MKIVNTFLFLQLSGYLVLTSSVGLPKPIVSFIKLIPESGKRISRGIRDVGEWAVSKISQPKDKSNENGSSDGYLRHLELVVSELKIQNAMLTDQITSMRSSVYFYKEKATLARKETEAIKKVLMSQIEDLQNKHEEEKADIITSMTKNHKEDIEQIRAELQEAFEEEKNELIEDMETLRLEEVGTIRIELSSEINLANKEIKKLDLQLKNEKGKNAERVKEVEKMKSRQNSMAEELENMKKALKKASEMREVVIKTPSTPVTVPIASSDPIPPTNSSIGKENATKEKQEEFITVSSTTAADSSSKKRIPGRTVGRSPHNGPNAPAVGTSIGKKSGGRPRTKPNQTRPSLTDPVLSVLVLSCLVLICVPWTWICGRKPSCA
eukprot:gene7032-14301_t